MRGIEQFNEPTEKFKKQRTIYFDRLAKRVKSSLRHSKTLGLFERNPDGTRKHQAPEHMLVVTARVEILVELLELDPAVQRNVTLAAAMHDAYKAVERAITKPLGFVYESFRIAEEAENQTLRLLGVDEELIELQNAAGHPFNEAYEKLNQQKELTDQDIAWFALFWADMGTRGVNPATRDPIEVRTRHDEPNYSGFHDSAKEEFIGDPDAGGFEAMRVTGHAAEKLLAERLSQKLNRQIDPAELLLEIDAEIARRIEGV